VGGNIHNQSTLSSFSGQVPTLFRRHWKWLRTREERTRSGTYLGQNMGIIGDMKVPVMSDKGQSLQHVDFVTYLLFHPQESIADSRETWNNFDTVLRQIYAQNPQHPAIADKSYIWCRRLTISVTLFKAIILIQNILRVYKPRSWSILGFGWSWSVISDKHPFLSLFLSLATCRPPNCPAFLPFDGSSFIWNCKSPLSPAALQIFIPCSASLKHAPPSGVYVSLATGDPTLWNGVIFVRSGESGN
jgi:hypothetical protein